MLSNSSIENEQSPSSSLSQQQSQSSQSGTRLVRSRFPKAQPNITMSSGMARIRRLSGHHTSIEQAVAAVAPGTPPPPPADSVHLLSPHVASGEHNHHHHQSPLSSHVILSPAPPGTPPLIVRQASTFRQFVLGARSPAATPQPPFSPLHVVNSLLPPTAISSASGPSHQTPTPLLSSLSLMDTSAASTYKPQFSKEHIMNIIKYKAMQKLKKDESNVSFRVSLYSA